MQLTLALQSYVKARHIVQKPEEGETLSVHDAIGAIAFYYEKIRNAIDYQDEHLIRQNAVRRIIARRMIVHDGPSDIAQGLLRELIRSRYIPNNTLPISYIEQVASLIEWYTSAIDILAQRGELTDRDREILLSLASCAIDECLVPMTQEEALVRLMYEFVEKDLIDQNIGVDEKTRKTQNFISTYRVLLRPDADRMRFFLFKSVCGACADGRALSSEQFAGQFHQLKGTVEKMMRHPLQKRLPSFLRKYRIPFIVLHTLLKNHGPSLLEHPDELEREVRKFCEKLYSTQRSRLMRRSIRAFIYIFLTKMVLGLGIELPYDLLTVHTINTLPLVLNILFPPVLLLVITLSAKLPGEENTERIVRSINEIVYDGEKHQIFVPQRFSLPRRHFFIPFIFWSLYVFVFVVSFGLIGLALNNLHFNIVSGTVFFMFLCLVTFFGVSLRRSVYEYVMVVKKPRLLAALLDPFFLPIIQVGRWLSFNISRINIFVFIFDVLIELPFQALIDITEEWFAFIREKKEEMD